MEEYDQKQQLRAEQNLRLVFPPPQVHPWLMFIHGKKEQNQTFFSLSDNCVYVKSIPNMRRKKYYGSYFGWMIFVERNTEDYFLLNPVSMEKIQLPRGSSKFNSCLLSSPPDDPNCIVLFVIPVGRGRASFMFCKPGDTDWSYQDLDIDKDEELHQAIACEGRIYAHVMSPHRGKLVSFDFVTSDFIVMEAETIPMLPYPEAPTLSFRMVESSGELFLVTLQYWSYRAPLEFHMRDIAIQKMDIYKKEWVKVENIGDRAFFVGRTCFTSCPTKESGIQGNTVYITIPEDRCLYAFDLEEKSLSIILPCPNVKENWSQADWVLPHL